MCHTKIILARPSQCCANKTIVTNTTFTRYNLRYFLQVKSLQSEQKKLDYSRKGITLRTLLLPRMTSRHGDNLHLLDTLQRTCLSTSVVQGATNTSTRRLTGQLCKSGCLMYTDDNTKYTATSFLCGCHHIQSMYEFVNSIIFILQPSVFTYKTLKPTPKGQRNQQFLSAIALKEDFHKPDERIC